MDPQFHQFGAHVGQGLKCVCVRERERYVIYNLGMACLWGASESMTIMRWQELWDVFQYLYLCAKNGNHWSLMYYFEAFQFVQVGWVLNLFNQSKSLQAQMCLKFGWVLILEEIMSVRGSYWSQGGPGGVQRQAFPCLRTAWSSLKVLLMWVCWSFRAWIICCCFLLLKLILF